MSHAAGVWKALAAGPVWDINVQRVLLMASIGGHTNGITLTCSLLVVGAIIGVSTASLKA
jgi:hypothetical protein